MEDASRPQVQTKRLNQKKKCVQDGVFRAEVNSLLQRSIARHGYAGIEVSATNTLTQIQVSATQIREVTASGGIRIRELASLIRKRFGYSKDALEIVGKGVINRGLCAAAQAESLKHKLLMGYPVRISANGVVRFAMRAGAKGVEVAVSGKLRAQRAKTMKFKQGYMITTGQPKKDFLDRAVRHVHLKQGVLGVKVTIMLPHDPEGVTGPSKPLPDVVTIIDPKEID